MSEARGLSRQQMCNRLAMEFGDGWIVNLGIGIPTLCSNFDFGDKEIIFHAENGVIGYGPLTGAGNEDLHLVNAGGQHVTLRPGAAIVHHADSFGLIRSGRIDIDAIDVLDGTPVIDIKPYFASTDAFPEATIAGRDDK